MKTQLFLAFVAIMFCKISVGQSVAISPSRLYYKVAVGEYRTQEVTLTNSSKTKQAFTVSFSDFEPVGINGKSSFMKKGESENSCSQWLSATPSFFELEPGQAQKVKVLIQVPSTPDANKVKWAAMQVKLTKEKNSSDSNDKNSIGLGVTETFQFVVHIFQSPPTVTYRSAEISSFREITTLTDTARFVAIMVKNTGEAILDCASYIELTNLQTGTEQRYKPFAFTLLPGAEREVKFSVPRSQPKGKYSLLGVIDYGSKENVQAAEIEMVFD
jgi:P pilus assembly chaperone PapD